MNSDTPCDETIIKTLKMTFVYEDFGQLQFSETDLKEFTDMNEGKEVGPEDALVILKKKGKKGSEGESSEPPPSFLGV